MTRIDYLNDPNAPEPNSVVPAAVGCVTDADTAVLLLEASRRQRSVGAPGRHHELGETIAETAVREPREETGWTSK